MADDSFYMYLMSHKGRSENKAIASNIVPFQYSKTVEENTRWKVAALRGKLSKTWATTPRMWCDIKRIEGAMMEKITLDIQPQRMSKISELTAKLRESLTETLKERKQKSDDWVKFGGTGGASRKITIQPGVSVIFSEGVKMVLRLEQHIYTAIAEPLNVNIKGDYLNNAHYDVLYLISPNVRGVLANNSVIKALTEITEDTKLYEAGDSIEFHKSNPTYHKWIGGDVSGKIEVHLTNSIGQPLHMEDGYLFVVLHFVKEK